MNTELIPVIHMVNTKQVFENVETCLKENIKKIFLINHHVSEITLLQTATQIKERYEDLWVGVNLLGVPVEDIITMPLTTDAVWCDQTLPLMITARRRYFGQLFTGGDFKYQKPPENLKEACEEATKSTDVIVTSGSGTGEETPIAKVKDMRNYIGNFPLAVASGVNVNNVENYKGIVNYLLVASSITDTGEMLNPEKLKELKNKL